MAEDEKAPDFDDLLAAFDIPDVSHIGSHDTSTTSISPSGVQNGIVSNGTKVPTKKTPECIEAMDTTPEIGGRKSETVSPIKIITPGDGVTLVAVKKTNSDRSSISTKENDDIGKSANSENLSIDKNFVPPVNGIRRKSAEMDCNQVEESKKSDSPKNVYMKSLLTSPKAMTAIAVKNEPISPKKSEPIKVVIPNSTGGSGNRNAKVQTSVSRPTTVLLPKAVNGSPRQPGIGLSQSGSSLPRIISVSSVQSVMSSGAKPTSMIFQVPPNILNATTIAPNNQGFAVKKVGRELVTYRQDPSTVTAVTGSINQPQQVAVQIPHTQHMTRADQSQAALTSDLMVLGASNPIPTYKAPAPPPRFGLIVPPNGFKCVECGDRFAVQNSLVHHKQRRSVSISFTCEVCKCFLKFYNKCAMLQHVRLHGQRGQKMESANTGRVMVAPLPKELITQAPVSKPPVEVFPAAPPPRQSHVVAHETPASQGPTIVSSATMAPQPQQVMTIPITIPNTPNATSQNMPVPLLPHTIRNAPCFECGKVFSCAQRRAEHFQGTDDEQSNVFEFYCSNCKMYLPSLCSLRAHTRTHKQEPPFICPECAEVIHGDGHTFLKHLKLKCHHFSRSIEYFCTKCDRRSFNHLTFLKQHIIGKHGEAYYKCQACPMAFKSVDSWDIHWDMTHGGKDKLDGYKSIFKCPLCDTVFHGRNYLTTHMDTHTQDLKSKARISFRCLQCKKHMDSREMLAEHLQKKHRIFTLRHLCNVCGVDFGSKQGLVGHGQLCQASKLSGFNTTSLDVPVNSGIGRGFDLFCGVCRVTLPSAPKLEQHNVTMKHFVCTGPCKQALKTKKLLSTHTCSLLADALVASKKSDVPKKAPPPPPPPKKIQELFPCQDCSAKFSSREALQTHMKETHGIVPQFPCHLCGLTYNSSGRLKKHVMMKHEGKRHAYTCWLCAEKNLNKTFNKKIMLERHISTYHKISKCHIDYSKMKSSLEFEESGDGEEGGNKRKNDEDEEPVKRLKVAGDKIYYCARCSFSSENHGDFMNHVARYIPKDTKSIQCTECGMCFVVVPSFQKHLFIVHKVKDFDDYVRRMKIELPQESDDEGGTQNGGSADVKEEEEEEDESSLDCRVCKKSFESKYRLRQHMRSHGMAFLRRKRKKTTSESNDSTHS